MCNTEQEANFSAVLPYFIDECQSADLLLRSRITFKNNFSTYDGTLVLKYCKFFFEFCRSLLVKIVSLMSKDHTYTTLEVWKATTCKLSTFNHLPLLGQSVTTFLCVLWPCSTCSNHTPFPFYVIFLNNDIRINQMHCMILLLFRKMWALFTPCTQQTPVLRKL